MWVVILVAVVVGLYALLNHPARHELPTPLLFVPVLIPLLIAVLGYLVTRHLVLDLADEV